MAVNTILVLIPHVCKNPSAERNDFTFKNRLYLLEMEMRLLLFAHRFPFSTELLISFFSDSVRIISVIIIDVQCDVISGSGMSHLKSNSIRNISLYHSLNAEQTIRCYNDCLFYCPFITNDRVAINEIG